MIKCEYCGKRIWFWHMLTYANADGSGQLHAHCFFEWGYEMLNELKGLLKRAEESA
ncbi:MAG: hypothetical protein KAR20_22915 [Candidatus Heimdallarchaeota archaeon]|nr:hypothetical protein [Candidatus Heimdallarchaeota archaeon]